MTNHSIATTFSPKTAPRQQNVTPQDHNSSTPSSRSAQPTRGRPGNSKDDILKAGVREFNQHGYEATSMGKLAKALGLTKSAIYHHVKSKEEILEYAIDVALSGLDDAFQASTASADPVENLRQIIRQSTGVLCANPEEVTLLLRLRGNSPVENQALQRRRNYTQTLVALIREAQNSGHVVSSLDPAALGRLIFGMINSITEWYDANGTLSANELVDTIESVIFSGIYINDPHPLH